MAVLPDPTHRCLGSALVSFDYREVFSWLTIGLGFSSWLIDYWECGGGKQLWDGWRGLMESSG